MPPQSHQNLTTDDPDLLDRLFDYLVATVPNLAQALSPTNLDDAKRALRSEFRGESCYIPMRGMSDRQQLVQQILSMSARRNAREIARELRISRATVYRVLRQPNGRKTKS